MAHVGSVNGFENNSNGVMIAMMDLLGEDLKRPQNLFWVFAGVVTVGAVFSNALWLQDQNHPSALFQTREHVSERGLMPDEMSLPAIEQSALGNQDGADTQVTRIILDPQAPAPAAKAVKTTKLNAENPISSSNQSQSAQPLPASEVSSKPLPDNDLRQLQSLLAELGYYKGEIDGLSGPKTRSAINSYKSNVGLKGVELDYANLTKSVRNNLIVTAAIPTTRPETSTPQNAPVSAPQRTVKTVRYVPPSSSVEQVINSSEKSDRVLMVQAGLRAFGNKQVTVDGVAGSQTTAAVKEFQSLFNLPVTGQIDDQLLSKMKSVGLIN